MTILMWRKPLCYLLILWRYSLWVQLLTSSLVRAFSATEPLRVAPNIPKNQAGRASSSLGRSIPKTTVVSPISGGGHKGVRVSWVLDSNGSLEMNCHYPGAQEAVTCNPNIKGTTSEKSWWWASLWRTRKAPSRKNPGPSLLLPPLVLTLMKIKSS